MTTGPMQRQCQERAATAGDDSEQHVVHQQ